MHYFTLWGLLTSHRRNYTWRLLAATYARLYWQLRKSSRVFCSGRSMGIFANAIKDENKGKTTYTSHLSTYCNTSIRIGLRDAPPTFQRALNIFLPGVRWEIYHVYSDDSVVIPKSNHHHIKDIDEWQTLLWQAEVALKLRKNDFFQNKMEYICHKRMPGCLAVASEKVDAINAEFSTDSTQMRSFLGAWNVNRRLTKTISKIAQPLNDYLRIKKVLKRARPYSWGSRCHYYVEI